MHQNPRLFIAINPSSGGNCGRKLFEQLSDASLCLAGNHFVCNVLQTKLVDHYDKINSSDVLVIAGGDGTISRIVNQLDQIKPPIFIIPLGTGNDLAREVGSKLRPGANIIVKLVEEISRSRVEALQVWRFENQEFGANLLFVNYISFGFDARIIEVFHQMRSSNSRLVGKYGATGNRIAYALASLRCLPTCFSPLQLNFIKPKIGAARMPSLMFTNIQSMAGLGRSNQLSNFSDRLIEGLRVRSPLDYFPIVTNCAVPAIHPHYLGQAGNWEFDLLKSCFVQIDGEPFNSLVAGRCTISTDKVISILVKN